MKSCSVSLLVEGLLVTFIEEVGLSGGSLRSLPVLEDGNPCSCRCAGENLEAPKVIFE